MKAIGKIYNRVIYYLSVRENEDWAKFLPTESWVVFTIADKADQEILGESVKRILNSNVTYICCAGELAGWTEQLFDEEICWWGIDYEEQTGKTYDFQETPMTTMHLNFSEGFWFAATLAYDDEKPIDRVVCIDFTKRKVENHLSGLVSKINDGWLPSDEEMELAEYDDAY